jgi:8-oxo-dGTP pyrophosphatase MutT (NUDIX family)
MLAKEIPTRKHIGVYGIHLRKNNSQVLLILKSRGPYKGMYDLPGGGIEKDEKGEDALKREYIEEIGVDLLSYKFFYEDLFTFPYLSQSEGLVNFQHKGYFYLVSLSDDAKIKELPDGQDSLGAVYININDIIEETVVVALMARKAILAAVDSF